MCRWTCPKLRSSRLTIIREGIDRSMPSAQEHMHMYVYAPNTMLTQTWRTFIFRRIHTLIVSWHLHREMCFCHCIPFIDWHTTWSLSADTLTSQSRCACYQLCVEPSVTAPSKQATRCTCETNTPVQCKRRCWWPAITNHGSKNSHMIIAVCYHVAQRGGMLVSLQNSFTILIRMQPATHGMPE